MAKISLAAVSAIGAGSLLVWSGIKGWSVLGTLGDLVTGVKPQAQVASQLVDPGSAQVSSGIGVAGGSSNAGGLAGIAQGYQGHAYKFGGAPGPGGTDPWDCSSMVNFIVALKMGWAIPGYKPGQYDGKTHGPATGQWAVWPGLTRVTESEVQAGDIIVWTGHMGIAISNTHMVSALNEREGTRETVINGTAPGPIVMRGRFT